MFKICKNKNTWKIFVIIKVKSEIFIKYKTRFNMPFCGIKLHVITRVTSKKESKISRE